MNKSRLGFLTTSGIIASILTTLIVAGVALAQGGMLFSPGGLNALSGSPISGVVSHAAIGGLCDLCHAPFWSASSMSDRCLACHTDVSTQWQDPSTLHGILHQSSPNSTCRTCHPDHRGAIAAVTVLPMSAFPHDKVGYSLAAHQLKTDGSPFTCSDCHGQNFTGFDQTICSNCHTQIDSAFTQTHLQDFGSNCKTCHDGVDSYGRNYDHNLAAFQLTGKHVLVPCGQCHINALAISDLQAAPQDCNSCHVTQDTHEGRLGTECGNCHNPTGWTPAKMDHNLTTFDLTGKHTDTPCASCHINKIFFGTPGDCESCHQKDDPHNEQFGSADCITCHTANGWTPSIYDHSLSTFKLEGRHVRVDCTACHTDNVFRGTPTDCYSCHKKDDSHAGQFGIGCGTCHTVTGWTPATVNHDLFTFKLTGRHVNLSCTSCHSNNVYIGTVSTCIGCHQNNDKHNGQFGTNCGNCHTSGGWLPAAFDHTISSFKLVGRHVNVSCSSCHVNNIYRGTSTSCYGCHQSNDTHNGQFGTSCGNCHTPGGWTPATFNHTRFALTGKHASLACSQCHSGGVYTGLSSTCVSCHAEPAVHAGQFGTNCTSCHTTSNWNATFSHTGFQLSGGHAGLTCSKCHTGGVYSGLSTACVSCHAEPAVHAGQFGTNCASCHTTTNWNASFNHPNACGEGGCVNHHRAACTDCHTTNNDYKIATCTKCHDSNNPGGG